MPTFPQENKVVCSEWSFTGLGQIAELCLKLGAMFLWVPCIPGFHAGGAAMGWTAPPPFFLVSEHTVGAGGCKEFIFESHLCSGPLLLVIIVEGSRDPE